MTGRLVEKLEFKESIATVTTKSQSWVDTHPQENTTDAEDRLSGGCAGEYLRMTFAQHLCF